MAIDDLGKKGWQRIHGKTAAQQIRSKYQETRQGEKEAKRRDLIAKHIKPQQAGKQSRAEVKKPIVLKTKDQGPKVKDSKVKAQDARQKAEVKQQKAFVNAKGLHTRLTDAVLKQPKIPVGERAPEQPAKQQLPNAKANQNTKTPTHQNASYTVPQAMRGMAHKAAPKTTQQKGEPADNKKAKGTKTKAKGRAAKKGAKTAKQTARAAKSSKGDGEVRASMASIAGASSTKVRDGKKTEGKRNVDGAKRKGGTRGRKAAYARGSDEAQEVTSELGRLFDGETAGGEKDISTQETDGAPVVTTQYEPICWKGTDVISDAGQEAFTKVYLAKKEYDLIEKPEKEVLDIDAVVANWSDNKPIRERVKGLIEKDIELGNFLIAKLTTPVSVSGYGTEC